MKTKKYQDNELFRDISVVGDEHWQDIVRIDGKRFVDFKPGIIEFNGYEMYKDMISQIADYLDNVEVTEETLAENKKLVARVRKASNELDSFRKAVKKAYEAPYTDYFEKIKELKAMSAEAEEKVRKQIRAFDEKQRADKEEEIRDLFEKRIRPYNFEADVNVEQFLEPKYLNKSYSMNKIEEEMVDWLENKKEGLEAINNTLGLNRFSNEYKQKAKEAYLNAGKTATQSINEIYKDANMEIATLKVYKKDLNTAIDLLVKNNITVLTD